MSQLPLSEVRSDAHGNMLGALLMAGSGYTLVPEVGRSLKLALIITSYVMVPSFFDRVTLLMAQVCIYFDHRLFRGNRSTKTSSTSFSPYSSPNFPPLATLGMNISSQFNKHTQRAISCLHASLHTHTVNEQQVRCHNPQTVLTLHPTMCPEVGTLTLFPGITTELVYSDILHHN